MAKSRLDAALVERGLSDSCEQAKRLIIAGEVIVNGHAKTKPGANVSEEDELVVKERPKYVGRGGLKMEGALEHFGIDPSGRICLDIGASTGGFTDCLLQQGAEHVYTLDVGTNQLAWKIRSDPRVTAREKFNARYLKPEDLEDAPSLIVIDVSFISLTKILPAAASVLESRGMIICLIKPQFELAREEIGKGGIVKDPDLHQKACDKIWQFVEQHETLEWKDVMDSPIKGTDGNREFLALLTV